MLSVLISKAMIYLFRRFPTRVFPDPKTWQPRHLSGPKRLKRLSHGLKHEF